LDLVRCIATARIVMPRTVVRLSAGRLDLSAAEQALAFMAGANSIFDGDKLLTTPNNDRNEDEQMFELLGLRSRPAFLDYPSGNDSSRHFAADTTTAAAAAAEPAAAASEGCCGGGCGSKQSQQQQQVAMA
jgi:biotin synthase